MTHTIGQRVRTTIELEVMCEGRLSAPAGTLGTVTSLPIGPNDGYGVVLDGVLGGVPFSLHSDEITAA